MDYKIILFYKYVDIDDPESLRNSQKEVCQRLGLKGRTIVAKEGINSTLEGTDSAIEEYLVALKSDPKFSDIHIKISEGTGEAFPKLSVKVRDEIVTTRLGDEDVNPSEITGKYITAEELHELFESGEEFYIIDMRNDYEHKVGHFENSVLPSFQNFRDLPKIVTELEHLKDKKIVTCCTGGVRCEKASGYLLTKGFKDVSQIYGGIVTYMEKYPNQNFLGELYVFDGRIVMGFNMDDEEHKVIGVCEICGNNSNKYINCAYVPCHKHFICCEECYLKEKENTVCEECMKKNVIVHATIN